MKTHWQVFVVFLCLASATLAGRQRTDAGAWVATWGTSSMAAGSGAGGQLTSGLEGHTIRQIVPLTVGGTAVRIRLSNRKGTGPFWLDDIYVGMVSKGLMLAAGSNTPITFDGKRSIMVPRGAEVISDRVEISLRDMQDIALSFHVTRQKGAPSVGGSGVQSHVAVGRRSLEVDASGFSRMGGAVLLGAVDVIPRSHVRGAVVAFGDSITAGGRTSWPGALATRLAAQTGPTVAVLNYGVGGNRLFYDSACYGDAGLGRLDEALSQSGVKALIFAGLGGNEIRRQDRPGQPGVRPDLDKDTATCWEHHNLGITSDELIAGVRQVVARAHARGIKVYGGYFPPFRGHPLWSAEKQSIQEAVNAWTRTAGAFDGIIDFAAPCVDPNDPTRWQARCDSGDQLHPSPTGSAVIANGMDVSVLLR